MISKSILGPKFQPEILEFLGTDIELAKKITTPFRLSF